MMTWAASGKFPGAAFLCICVDPNAFATAREFAQLYFKFAPDCLRNGYIDNQRDFPTFQANLGCQGFTIFNSAHEIVVPKTLPFTQYRDGAFRALESSLWALVQPPALENPLNAPVGQQVKIVNLTSAAGADLNGQQAEVVGSSENGRFVVKLSSGTNKSLRPENLEDAIGAPVGKRVRVFGLTSTKGQALNGQFGEVLGGVASGRYMVKLGDAGAPMLLRPENLEDAPDVAEVSAEEISCNVPSVNHAGMDSQHESCAEALRTLTMQRSVVSLRRVRDELAEHFKEEEALLQDSGFGQKVNGNDFSAFDSHAKDHQRIVALADAALLALANVCEASQGSVSEQVVVNLRRAFAEHAQLYDTLYADKLVAAPVGSCCQKSG
eukprot:gnl/TRDRNA2_/TRDRNA2_164947_c0_seq3.p1 gnl/TRDRNA2_/TRDRNA2_164947_c0~~gnl/TRDRNA2_/TRDRNA2_164947_c0_seq3.p1  ORF type:complete len:381 (-),score=68.45 gnl/TRDRNA2_/TRDRNA2_164947_c0_seq3:141-1283(-)